MSNHFFLALYDQYWRVPGSSLSLAVDTVRRFLRADRGNISKAKKRLIFLATWKMLDEAEREFAASLFVQVWWRRWLYRDRPDEMAKCVGWSASRSRIRGI